jgi:hypothetical protein
MTDEKEKFLNEVKAELNWVCDGFGGPLKITTFGDQEFLSSGAIALHRNEIKLEELGEAHYSEEAEEKFLKRARVVALNQRRTPIKKDLVEDISKILVDLFYIVGKNRSVLVELRGSLGTYGESERLTEICREFNSVEMNPLVTSFLWGVGLIYTTDTTNAIGVEDLRDLYSKANQKLRSDQRDAERSKNTDKENEILRAREVIASRLFLFGGGRGLNNERPSDFLLETAIQIFYITLEKYLQIYKAEEGKDLMIKRVLPLNSTEYPEGKDALNILGKSSKKTEVFKATSRVITCQVLYFLGIKNSIGGIYSVNNVNRIIKGKTLLQAPLDPNEIKKISVAQMILILQSDIDVIVDNYLPPNEDGGKRPRDDNRYLP